MSKIVIGLAGPIASGKGVACDYLKTKYHAGYHRFSTMIRDVIRRLYIEESRENMQKLSLVLRQTFGQDLFAQALNKEIIQDENEVICVDGIRREEDITYLKKLDNFVFIYIDADVKTRYERTVNRAENASDHNKTYEQFVTDHSADTEMTIPPLKQFANELIENNGTMEELERKIDEIVEKYK